MKKVAMIGVGKLGQDCAEVMADAGYEVVGYDVEPRLPMFPMKDSIEEAVKDRDFIFIAAPTPHDPIYGGETPTSHLPNKDFDYTIVKNILTEVNKYVNKNQLVVLISTVLPGTVRSLLEPCITNARFIYNPYLIAMGTIKWDMINPEMVIIGTDDGSITGDARELIDFYKVFMENDPRYEVGTWDEAESIKIFYNTFISTKLALVNMIQDVAETNGNINVDVVTNALKKSTYRIMGPAYMTAALGDAGACHPRDNIALRWLADRLDLGYDLFDSIMTAREVQAERMALRCLKNGKNVTIIGKAYKPAVPYTNGSASMLVGYYIEKHGGNLNYYDPNTSDNDMRENWTQVYLIGYWEDWVEKIVFKDPGVVVIDPWRKLDSRQHSGEIIHYGDTRTKSRYEVPESTIKNMRSQLIDNIFPELKQYDDQIHLIDATIPFETMFILRPTEDIINEIKKARENGKTKFLFNAATEGFMPHVLSKIQRIASILDGIVEDKDIFYVSGVPDADEIYERIRSTHIWNKRINMLNSHFFKYVTTLYARDFEYVGSYESKYKDKAFLCFNKLNREHRMVLMERMLENNLHTRGFYSFEGEDDFKGYIPSLDENKYPYIKMNQGLFPLRLNITEDRHNPVDIRPDDLSFYRDSYFSIVTETLFYGSKISGQHHKSLVEDCLFLTEKTYRCFALLHPFILMARPHSLKLLREQGFKTFSPFIDESYDSIVDDHKRFEAIWKEIIRLTNFTPNDWQVWQEGIKDIVEFNKQHFHEDNNFAATKDYIDFFNGASPAPRKPMIKQEQPTVDINIPSVTVSVATPEFSSPAIPSTPSIAEYEPVIIHNTGDNNLDWRNKTVTYENGLSISFPIHCDGGGYEICEELFSLISRTGKENYKRAFEWCSGYGPLAFYMLDKRMVDHVVVSDCYDIAVDCCIQNAKENNLADKVTGYTSDVISVIPVSTEKFDLVVANPPHSGNREAFVDSLEHPGNIENTCRLIVDHDYQAHQEFFRNIKRYLTDDADVYITANSNMEYFVALAEMGGLKCLGFCPSGQEHHGIFHFKPRV